MRKLVLGIELDTQKATTAAKQFDAALDKVRTNAPAAGKGVEKFEQSTQRATTATTSMVNMIGRYVSMAAIGMAIKQTISWGDSIGEMSEATGIGTQKLQQLTYAANQAGPGFERMIGQINNLNVRLGAGDKSTIASLNKLGLSFKDLQQLGPDKQIEEIARAMNATGMSGQQLTKVFRDLFGGGGEQLIPMFRDLNRLMREAPTATDKTIDALGKLDEKFKRLTATGKTFLAEVLNAIASPLTFDYSSPSGFMADVMDWLGYEKGRVDELRRGGAAVLPKAPGSPTLPTFGGLGAALDPRAADMAFRLVNPGFSDSGRFDVARDAAKAAEKEWDKHWDEITARSKQTTERLMADASAWVNYLRTYVHPAARDASGVMTPSIAMLNVPGASVRNIGNMPIDFGNIGSGGSPVSITSGGFWGSNWGKVAQAGMGGALGGLMSGNVGAAAGGTASSLLSMIPVVGSFLAPLGGLLGGLFGGNKEYKQVKSDRASFEGQFGGADGLIKAVSEAYATLGRSGAEAEAALKQLWNAKDAKSYEAAVKQITKAIEEAGDKTAKLAQITALEDQIKLLQEQGAPTWQSMQAMAEKYGIALDGLGQNFAQLKITDTAQDILSAYEHLTEGGADSTAVLAGMSDEISKLVQDSLQFGTTIPENMRPLLEALMASGQLLDANGEKITDINQLSFGDAVKTDAQLLADTIKDLRDAIDKLRESLREVPDVLPNPFAGWNIPDPGDWSRGGGSGSDDQLTARLGGSIAGWGLQRYGTGGLLRDERLIVGHVGEGIVSRRGMRMLGMLNAGAVPGGGEGLTIGAIHIHGDVDSESRVRRLAQQVSEQVMSRYTRLRKVAYS